MHTGASFNTMNMAAILQMAVSKVFCWMKSYILFHIALSFFLQAKLTICLHWFRQWLGAKQATSHYLNQWWASSMMQWVNSLRPSDEYICVSKLAIIGSDDGLSPGRRQAVIWTNSRILLIGPQGTNFNEILIEVHTFPLKKIPISKCCLENGGHFVSASMC